MRRSPVPIWLDCDPGHDDACAIMLAGHNDIVQLLGISTVMGNQTIEKTTLNACKVVSICGLEHIPIVRGQDRPLVEPLAVCPEIHGESGLDSESTFPSVTKKPEKEKAVMYMAQVLLTHSEPVTIIATACLTNIALLIRLYPEVMPKVKEVVILGGSVGTGNIGTVAEWNIMVDPEAAKIVYECGLPIVNIGLQVTHTALVTPDIMNELSSWNTPFARLLVDLLKFYAGTYDAVFKFPSPPLHDPLAVAYVIAPELFTLDLMRVDIETRSDLTRGQTVCDVYHLSKKTPNVHLAIRVDVPGFWKVMMAAWERCNAVSSLNKL